MGVLEREAERGEMERRGDWSRGGERTLAAVGVCERVRERPRSGEGDPIAQGEPTWMRRLIRYYVGLRKASYAEQLSWKF